MTHERARGYTAAHMRVRQARGPARKHICPCGKPAAQWAYDHNDPNPRTETMPTSRGRTVVVTWSDDPAHYIAMCYRCHARLDLECGNRSNIGAAYREMRAAAPRERCRRGHILAGANLEPWPLRVRGLRVCLACARTHGRQRTARRNGLTIDFQAEADRRYVALGVEEASRG